MPAAAPALTYLPDLLEEHVEEIEFLWSQRQIALSSPRYTLPQVTCLDERIEAHVQGVLAAGEPAIALLQRRLSEDSAAAVFASAYCLLQFGGDHAAPVLQLFHQSGGACLQGLTQALRIAPEGAWLSDIASQLSSNDPAVATAAAEVLVFHRKHEPTPGRLLLLVQEEDPDVRIAAWRVAGYLGLPLEPKLYASAMRDEDVRIRSSALAAAAWSRLPGALGLARQIAQKPSIDNLAQIRLLAILGDAQDVGLMTTVARSAGLGPERFELIGSFGHPGMIEGLIQTMEQGDATSAGAAAAAFTKITGLNVDSGRRTFARSSDDDFDAEFQDEVVVPNSGMARKLWAEHGAQLKKATRLGRGLDLGQGLPTVLDQLDMESRQEAYLRARFQGTWAGSLAGLERFPLCLTATNS
jgi:uncharacterized protein (TIGR02270 family)